MKKIQLLATFLFFSCLLSAQPGTLDGDFDGDGIVFTDFGGNGDGASAIKVQPDGRIVAAGASTDGTYADFALARYFPDGSPDNSFDTDGKVTTDFNGYDDRIRDAALQPDGKIVVAGHTSDLTSNNFALARYLTDGTLDNTFSFDGKVTTAFSGVSDGAQAVIIQPDGKIIAAGLTNNGTDFDFAMVRYNADGTLDNSFSSDGKLTTDVNGNYEQLGGAAIQPDGKIILGGRTGDGIDDDFLVVRYNTDGTIDNSFSSDGMVTSSFSSGIDAVNSLALDAAGKITAIGFANIGAYGTFAVARYHSDGTPDASFDGDGQVFTDVALYVDLASAGLLQPDGKILAAGGADETGSGLAFALVRYNADGSLDQSFGTGGITITYAGTGTSYINDVALQADGKILAAGSGFATTVDFTIARYFSGLNIGLEESVVPVGNLVVHPNPAFDVITLEYSGQRVEEMELVISDLPGKQVYKESFNDISVPFRREIDLHDFASGTYFIMLRTPMLHINRSLVIAR